MRSSVRVVPIPVFAPRDRVADHSLQGPLESAGFNWHPQAPMHRVPPSPAGTGGDKRLHQEQVPRSDVGLCIAARLPSACIHQCNCKHTGVLSGSLFPQFGR